jgi:hypothetical protein
MTVLTPMAKPGPKQPPLLTGRTIDLEAVLPLKTIRQHCKIDDVIRVPDTLLALYRAAAFGAAEVYTGLLFQEIRVITQSAENKRDLTAGHKWKDSFKLRLDYPTADGVLYLYGGKHTLEVNTITVEPGSIEVQIPINHYAIDATPCCVDPCGSGPANYGRKLMYKAGLADETAMPPNVILGVLKYIAFVVENNGGDNPKSENQASVNPQTSANNISWKSGAIEEWRLVTREF